MTNHTIRNASHPEDYKSYSTGKLREHFIIPDVFVRDAIQITYSHFDRFIVGGAKPLTGSLTLDTIPVLRAGYFLERREIGIINIGTPSIITADGKDYLLNTKEAIYLGQGIKSVVFHPSKQGEALFYFNSAPAHTSYPTRKISISEAETVETGTAENSNQRIIYKLMIHSVLPTCQLQMGLTQLKSGSVWNTMPPHVHDRRMEAYFYFDLPPDNTVCHLMGPPEETRHLWVKNHEAVISPPWSIHSGAGTSSYSFIWGMAGENVNYSDMDPILIEQLR